MTSSVTRLKEENELCKGVAALMAAIQWTDYKKVNLLIEGLKKEGRVDVKLLVNAKCGPMSVLPLQLAADVSDPASAFKIVKTLINNGAQVTLTFHYLFFME